MKNKIKVKHGQVTNIWFEYISKTKMLMFTETENKNFEMSIIVNPRLFEKAIEHAKNIYTSLL